MTGASAGGGHGLLVVGGPTHAFGMSRASTRRDAARYTDGPLVSRAAAARRLCRLGFDVAGATSFHVEGATGPLVDGEAERARRWGEQLVAQVGARPVSAG